MQDYGGFSKINDTLGILLEYKDGIGSLSFYRNQVTLTHQLTLIETLRDSLRQYTPGHLLPGRVHVLRGGASDA